MTWPYYPNSNKPPLSHDPKHHIQTVFKGIQGWWLNHLLGEPIPVLHNPFCKEAFLISNLDLPGATWGHFPSSCHQWEETNPALTVISYQVFEESNKVSSQPPLPQKICWLEISIKWTTGLPVGQLWATDIFLQKYVKSSYARTAVQQVLTEPLAV